MISVTDATIRITVIISLSNLIYLSCNNMYRCLNSIIYQWMIKIQQWKNKSNKMLNGSELDHIYTFIFQKLMWKSIFWILKLSIIVFFCFGYNDEIWITKYRFCFPNFSRYQFALLNGLPMVVNRLNPFEWAANGCKRA
jgi:hypothetical protein